MPQKKLPDSAIIYVLKGLLIPYSAANKKLAFKPELFFSDLEKISRMKKASLRSAFYRAKKQGLFEHDANKYPSLTNKGKRKVKPFVAERLGRNASLLLVFDIPEQEAWKRRHLRQLLRELAFEQVQKSVWRTEYDHRELLKQEIKELKLANYVIIYEAATLDVT